MKRWVQQSIIICLTIFTFKTASGEQLDRIAVVVNDSVITQSQLEQQIRVARQQLQQSHLPVPEASKLRAQIVQHLIDTQLQLQTASKLGIKVSDKELNQAINQIAHRNGISIEQMQAELKRQGMNFVDFRQEIRRQMTISQLQQRAVGASVIVSSQDVDEWMKKIPKQTDNGKQTEYHVVDLVIPFSDKPTAQEIAAAQQRAQKLVGTLRAGTDFKQAVLAGSDEQPPLQGSDLRWHKLSSLPDLFVPYVQRLQPGDISRPIQAPNGFHIIKLVEIKGQAKTLEQVTQTHVRHILIKATPLETDAEVKARLEQMRTNIMSGESFAKLASANSQDPGSASKGGDLGWAYPGTFDPIFEAEIDQLKIDEISHPFKTQFGWHIVQVLGRKSSHDESASLRNQAQQLAYQHKFQEAIDKWLQQLRKQAYIKVM